MTLGRVCAMVEFNDIKYITFHDAEGERVKQIDVKDRAYARGCHIRIMDTNMMNMEHILDCLEKMKSW